MKLVINKCYGGFGLSVLGYKRYAELIGKSCYFFNCNISAKENLYTPITLEEAEKDFCPTIFTIPNPNEVLGDKEGKEFNELYDTISLYSRDFERHDENLVKVVEELKEKASSSLAKLEVVEIPDNIEYTIEEYDGIEHIAEKHQTWG